MRPADWTAKGKADFVTEVDKEAERLIAASLTVSVPGSIVMGEELSPTPPIPDPRSPTPVVWIVDPYSETVAVHRLGLEPKYFTLSDELPGDPELPGFRCAVAEIFE